MEDLNVSVDVKEGAVMVESSKPETPHITCSLVLTSPLMRDDPNAATTPADSSADAAEAGNVVYDDRMCVFM